MDHYDMGIAEKRPAPKGVLETAMTQAAQDRDYVLGTHDEEIERLGLQHRVWRPRALAAWREAGFSVGQTILDIGCGPGYAAVDLAEIVGPTGRVIAVERSRRFLDYLEAQCKQRAVINIATRELDLDQGELPRGIADGAWSRWVFSFLKGPRRALQRVRDALRPGAVLVLHEYYNYGSWRAAPRSTEVDEFVAAVMKSWRADGGEPDIALDLIEWLNEDGFEIRAVRPIVEVVCPSDFGWQWLRTFMLVGLQRLEELHHVSAEKAASIRAWLRAAESNPNQIMIAPSVMQIVATQR